MINGLNVLVVEDEELIALNIAEAVAEAGGQVIGPVPSVAEALAIVDREAIDAAILDANLLDRDITPVVTALLARGTPLVVHTAAGLPDELHGLKALIPVVAKPAPPHQVITVLARLVKP
jgi:DNA-binding response OmpR family regulator